MGKTGASLVGRELYDMLRNYLKEQCSSRLAVSDRFGIFSLCLTPHVTDSLQYLGSFSCPRLWSCARIVSCGKIDRCDGVITECSRFL
jgi:hypothetical protein